MTTANANETAIIETLRRDAMNADGSGLARLCDLALGDAQSIEQAGGPLTGWDQSAAWAECLEVAGGSRDLDWQSPAGR